MFSYPGNPAGGGSTAPAPGRHNLPTGSLPVDVADPTNAASVDPAGFQAILDWLAYFQVNGALGDALGGGATSFDGPSNPTAWNDMLTANGSPVSGLDVLPTFAAGGGFAVVIGAGAGFLYTSAGKTPGESDYRALYWSSQSKTLANPDATQARIDAITVTPAAPGTESTIGVVTGTPATPPLPPAIPSGSGAVFYVLVPAAAASAAAFRACRGLWRRIGYPWSGQTAVVDGVELSWNYAADATTTDAGLFVGAGDQTGTNATISRVLIDGELLEWVGYGSAAGGNVFRDVSANPFSTPASSSFDRPYYVYACGGRHNPFPSYPYVSGSPFLCPVAFVESTTPPNPKTGKPTANMSVNGVAIVPDGAVYIGLGFVAAGTTLRRGCIMDSEMTRSMNPLGFIGHNFTTNGAEDLGTFTGNGQPAISTKVVMNALFTAPTAQPGALIIKEQNFPATAGLAGTISGFAAQCDAAKAVFMNGLVMTFTPRTGAEIWATMSSSATAGSGVLIGAMGFDHRVRRLTAGW